MFIRAIRTSAQGYATVDQNRASVLFTDLSSIRQLLVTDATIQQGQLPTLCGLDELGGNRLQQRGGPNSCPETQPDFIHFTTIRPLLTAILPWIPPMTRVPTSRLSVTHQCPHDIEMRVRVALGMPVYHGSIRRNGGQYTHTLGFASLPLNLKLLSQNLFCY